MMANGVLAPPFRPSWSSQDREGHPSADAAVLCDHRPFFSLLSDAAQHVLPLITSINGMDTIAKNPSRNHAIQPYPITPLTACCLACLLAELVDCRDGLNES